MAVEELRKRRPGLTVSCVRSWPHNRSRSQESLAQCSRVCAGRACHSGTSIEARAHYLGNSLPKGGRPKEITRKFNIPVTAVENRRMAVMNKIKLSQIAALSRYAVRNDIIEP